MFSRHYINHKIASDKWQIRSPLFRLRYLITYVPRMSLNWYFWSMFRLNLNSSLIKGILIVVLFCFVFCSIIKLINEKDWKQQTNKCTSELFFALLCVSVKKRWRKELTLSDYCSCYFDFSYSYSNLCSYYYCYYYCLQSFFS